MYVRCRPAGSEEMWFWLARIINGKSQQVRIRRGVERGSVAIYTFMHNHPVSVGILNQARLARAMIRLWARVVDQSRLKGESQIVGIIMIVGKRIFSTVID